MVRKFSSDQAGIFIPPPTYLRVSALVAGSDILKDIRSALVVGSSTFGPLVWRRFSRAIDPKVLSDSRDFLKFLEGLLRDCEKRPWKFFS